MCGIAGYVGPRKSIPVIVDSLEKLEYRGYDSAGIAFFEGKQRVKVVKNKGSISLLKKKLGSQNAAGEAVAIGHNRWATHGQPNEVNAHPHCDCAKRVFVVHNGIIENYQELKESLTKKKHRFVSQTDTEVVAHLIEEELKKIPDFAKAFERSLKRLTGTYALVVIDSFNPGFLYIVRLGSPLIVGLNNEERLIVSDPVALIGRFKKAIFLKDGQWGVVSGEKNIFYPKAVDLLPLKGDAKKVQLGEYPHFMLREIFEGPDAVAAALKGRLKKDSVVFEELESLKFKLKKINRLKIIACGTSYYAGLIGEYLFEEIAKIPTEVVLASEWRYKSEPTDKEVACLFISQSGETADTLAALQKAKNEGYLCLGIVNVVGSSIARYTDSVIYNNAGPEIGVASTKAFLSQVAVLTLLASFLGNLKGQGYDKKLLKELSQIQEKMCMVLKMHKMIDFLTRKYFKYKNFLFLGRKYDYPAALEGALKLKEIAYVHAEGYAGGEMKHGPLALIDKKFPTIAIAVKSGVYEKMISNLEEIKARSGPILAIATGGDQEIKKVANDVFYVPKTLEVLGPLLNVIPLQLFAYYFGVKLGYNVDKPRNLAKSVTVE